MSSYRGWQGKKIGTLLVASFFSYQKEKVLELYPLLARLPIIKREKRFGIDGFKWYFVDGAY